MTTDSPPLRRPARFRAPWPVLLALATALGACGDEEATAPPAVGFLFPADDDAVTSADDVDAAREGIQIDVQLAVLDFGETGTITVEIEDDDASRAQLPVDGDSTYVFRGFSVPAGNVRLRAELLDAEGTLVAAAEIFVTVEELPGEGSSFRFTTPGEDGLVFGPEDDIGDDPFDGFQTDLAVEARDVPDGTMVTIRADGVEVARRTLDGGTAEFEAVTLPGTGPAGRLVLVAEAEVDEDLATGSRTLTIDVPCVVEMAPEPGAGECSFDAAAEDLSEVTPGFQTELALRSNCSQANLNINGALQSAFVPPEGIVFLVTLYDGANTIRADVFDDVLEPAASTGELEYVVDRVAPSVALTEPAPGTRVTPEDDADAAPGVQIAVTGTVAELAEGDEVELRIAGEPAGTAEVAADGTFAGLATVGASGTLELTAIALDACDNEGASAAVELLSDLEIPALAITFPAPDHAFLAAGDPDGGLYQAEFEIAAQNLTASDLVEVQCRRMTGVFSTLASAAADGETLAIPVELPSAELVCRALAMHDEAPIVSPEVHIWVDNQAPVVTVTSPQDESSQNVDSVNLAAFVTQFDPTGPVSYRLNGGEPVEVTLVDGGFTAAVTLQAGENVIEVSAQEMLSASVPGNLTVATVLVTFDTTAPVLVFLQPPGATATVADGDPRLQDGYLYDVLVSADDVAAGGEICLRVNSSAEVCQPASDAGDHFEGSFDDTFILPGDNDLDARASDDAGNEGTAHQDLTFTTDLARLEVVAGVRTSPSFLELRPLDGAVVGANGGLDIHVQTSGLDGGEQVQLRVNGVVTGTLAPDGGGLVVFPGIQLLDETSPSLAGQDGWNELQAVVAGDAVERSPIALVRVDTTPPVISFVDLVDGGYLSFGGGFSDADPRAGFQAGIAAAVTGVEAGQLASLDVDCSDDAFDASVGAAVSGDSATFVVDVPLEGACTFTANVSDRAGNDAPPATADVTIDLVRPLCEFLAPTSGQVVDFTFDTDATTAGIQMDVQIRVSDGIGDVTLTDGSATIDLTEPLAGQNPATVTFLGVDLPEGDIQLTAEAFDEAGNSCDGTIDVTVFSSGSSLAFFALGAGDCLSSADDDGPAPGFQGDIQVVSNGSFPGSTVILCRRTDAPPAGTRCTGSYEEVGATVMAGFQGSFTEVALPEGEQTLRAELLLGGPRLLTPELGVLVDTVGPTVTSWILASDVGVTVPELGLVGNGDGILNAAEAPGRRIGAIVTLDGISGSRGIVIRSSSTGETVLASGLTTGTFSFTTVALPEGTHVLRAETTDSVACANPVQPGAATLTVGLDTVLPSLSWEFPVQAGRVLAADDANANPDDGAQVEIVLLSDAGIGRPVYVTGALEGPLTLPIGVDNRARRVNTDLAAGDIDLSATTYDVAFNGHTAVAQVTVDVRPPTIGLSVPGPVADADAEAPGFQLDLQVDTTWAEVDLPGGAQTGIVNVASSLTGLVGQAPITATTPPDEASSLTVRVDLVEGTHQLTASVSDLSGNVAVSAPVEVEVDVAGCGLRFTNPAANPFLVDATGFSGDPASDPKLVPVQLAVTDLACGDAGDPAQVRLRLGCALGAADGDCAAVYTTDVQPSGLASFEGGNAIALLDGTRTTMHALVVHPTTGEVSTTEQKSVVVDLVPPQVGLLRPDVDGGEDVLGLRLDQSSAEWSVDGASLVGPLSFSVDDVFGASCNGQVTPTRCVFTARYANGTVLADSTGPVSERSIGTAGAHTVSLTGVRYPTVAGAAGTTLEVVVVDEVGNVVVASAALNVDSLAPSAPATFVIDQSPYLLGGGGERSGEADMSWSAARDDDATGPNVTRYEIRALCTQRTSRPLRPGEPSQNCADADWTDLAIWEARPLVAEISGGALAYHNALIGLDEDWTIGLRAFDDADNWSPVVEGFLSTRLRRRTLHTFSPDVGVGIVSLGDVNGDGREDLLASYYNQVRLVLGEADPANPAIAGNPFGLVAPAIDDFFGSSVAPAGDVNGDGLNDFVVGSIGQSRVYLYFGSASAAALVSHDVTFQGPADGTFTEQTYSRSGFGNFVDLGGQLGFDDLYFNRWDFFGDLGGDPTNWVYVVAGRPTGSWPSQITIDVSANAFDLNCANNVISIAGTNGGDFPISAFGLNAGLTTLNDDAFADLVAGTEDAAGAVGAAQWVFYGGAFDSCAAVPYEDLSDASVDVSLTASTASDPIGPYLGVRPTDFDEFGNFAAAGAEYAVGLFGLDRVEVRRFDADSPDPDTHMTIYQTITSTRAGQERFGQSVAFAGNLDQDPDGLADLVIGAPSSTGVGRAYAALGADADPRFRSTADFDFDREGAGNEFGYYVAGDFDFNGDGYPDFVVLGISNHRITLFY